MRFESLQTAYVHLRIQALKHGFDIGSTQSFHSVYSTFYCLKGGRQRGDKTTKTGCNWKLQMVPDERAECFGAVRIKGCVLEHNHELHPDIYSVFTLNEQTQDLIRLMRDANIEPRKIIKVMDTLGGQGLTAAQIRKVCAPRGVALGTPESCDLEQYIRELGGSCFRCVSDGRYCQGILTILPFEKENLERFATVIFLDGTQTNSHLQWEVIPITLVDQYRRIRSGGLCFLASTDEETLTWLLETLFSLPPIRNSTRTVITDEDSAFIPAISNICDTHDVKHVLCSYHKERNFSRKLLRCGLTHLEREIAKDLFRSVCYGTDKEFTSHAIDRLKKMSPKLAKYINKQVIPTLDQFARSHLADTFCKGYNTTSPAESHNAMLKNYLAGRSLTLKQTRIEFTRCHVEADKSFKEKILRSFRNEHFTFVVGKIMLSPKIRTEIDQINELVGKYCCVEHDDGSWRVFPTDAPQTTHIATCEQCDCGRVTYEGLPCVHILRVIKETIGDDFGHWPFHLVAPDWIIRAPNHVIVGTDEDGVIENGGDTVDPEEEVNEDDIVVPSDAIDIGQSSHQLRTEDIGLMCNIPEHMKQKRRYLRLYHLAKSVVSLASRDPGNSSQLFSELLAVKQRMLSLPTTESTLGKEFVEDSEHDDDQTEDTNCSIHEDSTVIDVVDIAGRRRGRKKKSINEQRKKLRQTRAESCQLCGKQHNIAKCRKYPDFQAAIKHNRGLPDQDGKRRCRMCLGIGHNTKTCPWLASNSKSKYH